MTGLFTIPNLSASVVDVKKPWGEKFDVPEFDSTIEFKQWAARPNTQYLAYSTAEGVDASQRVSKQNRPRYLHGFCADWDAKFDDDEYTEFVGRLIDSEFPASWVSRSYSGGIHAVWLLKDPLVLHVKASDKFLRRVSSELGLSKLARGFDRKAFMDPFKYYLHGHDWKKVSTKTIPSARLHLWQFETTGRADFDTEGVEIPLDTIHEEIDKQFPGGWTGTFVEGARGKRFWDPQADNPTAAVVRSTGIQCFSGDTPFKTWSDLLGARFVNQFTEENIGGAIEAYYYDGKNYFQVGDSGDFTDHSKEDVLLDLQVSRGLSNRRRRNENVSELLRALHMIQTNKRVAAAVPFVFAKEKVVRHNNLEYFNTCRVRPLTPAKGKGKWGQGFPDLAKWMEHMFGEEQLRHELAWLAYAYVNAHAGTPKRGHAHFLVGPPNCGKTLYNTVVLGGLFGGHVKASEYLVGKTMFNDYLFETGLWTVDDEAPTAGMDQHTSFTSKIKEFVANEEFVVNGKFRKSGRVLWRGRLSISLNNDPVSMRLLPDLDMSIRDKLVVYMCRAGTDFAPDVKEVLEKQLPCFARYLMGHKIPKNLASSRFGVKEYMNSDIHKMAAIDSRYAYVDDLLTLFRRTHCLEEGEEWEGTCSDLLLILSNITGCGVLLRDVTPKKLGWGLSHLVSKGVDGLKRSDVRGSYKWVISEPTKNQETTTS